MMVALPFARVVVRSARETVAGGPRMKKTTTKLMVRRETIQTLTNRELGKAGGRGQCVNDTRQVSGCIVPPNQIVVGPGAK
jgi:hypothetical protein